MGKHYSHLSLHERQLIFNWHHYHSISIRECARRLGRHHSTISRELKRNISTIYVPTWYPHPANRKYRMRIRDRGERTRLKNETTRQFVIEKLKDGWTPEIIAGRLKLDNKLSYTCHESIYQFIYKELPELIQYLPRKHKKRKKKYPYRKKALKVEQKTSILERPEVINQRNEPGHWESDSIVSPQQKPGCNVLVERYTRLTHITRLSTKDSESTKIAIITKLNQYPSNFVRSITYDNGCENTQHLNINQELDCQSFFCQPYHSWEKGSVEQTNSLIRRRIPKKSDITNVSDGEIKEVEDLLNNKPRKCLGYKTPLEVYSEIFESR